MILLLSAFVKVNRGNRMSGGSGGEVLSGFSVSEGVCSALDPGECPGTEFQVTSSREGESVTCTSIISVPTRALMLPGTHTVCSECATGLASMIPSSPVIL